MTDRHHHADGEDIPIPLEHHEHEGTSRSMNGNTSSHNHRYPNLHRRFMWVVVKTKIALWSLAVASRDPLKRMFDVVGSSLLLTLLSPVFLLTYIAIKLEDGGPAIFVQTRVGKWGKHFRFYKFRSMLPNAEDMKKQLLHFNEMKGVTFKMKDDPRITRVGRFIRKFSIDELPQLFCVLKGDMSLVGPRPPVPSEVAEYKNHHLYRLDATPGITCIWQVSGRNEIQFEDQVKLDVQYIHRRSIKEDIKLLLKTVYAVISARGAS
jgi:lipopolysaccharide/colanic/teichoic acid biosynthesis glycosyltransferase